MEQNAKIEKTFPKFFAGLRIGKIECKKETPAARGGDHWFLALQIAELIQEVCAHFRGVLDKMFFLDDAQEMGRAHHISEISAPG